MGKWNFKQKTDSTKIKQTHLSAALQFSSLPFTFTDAPTKVMQTCGAAGMHLCADSHTMAKAQIDVVHTCMTVDLHAPCRTGLFTGCSLFKAQWLEVSSQQHTRLTSRSFSFSSASVSFTLLTNICRISSSLRCRSPRNSFLLASYVS